MTETNPSDLTLVVRSPAFGANGMIPMEFSAEADNVPPPLVWERVPEGTRSIAIICEDPDAPTRVFTHWIVVGIPPTATRFDPAAPPDTIAYGRNDHGSIGWYGPNPPNGRHRYFFKVFALDINLDKPNLEKAELYAAIKGHVLARGELVGTYEKKAGAGRGPRANMPSSTGSHR
jgi:Raf kinase inhibitor-like YbhB/YbcL family protein